MPPDDLPRGHDAQPVMARLPVPRTGIGQRLDLGLADRDVNLEIVTAWSGRGVGNRPGRVRVAGRTYDVEGSG
jgi:hypothetical protein